MVAAFPSNEVLVLLVVFVERCFPASRRVLSSPGTLLVHDPSQVKMFLAPTTQLREPEFSLGGCGSSYKDGRRGCRMAIEAGFVMLRETR
jgi:hypothetical protein